MAQPDQPTFRGTEQLATERAMAEVSDVLLNVEHALDRAKRARKTVEKLGSERNVELALADTARELERVRKALLRDTYHQADTLRLL